MISVKYAIIMAVGAFAAGSFFASPLPEAIASTIANDVICSGCVGTSDLASNAVTAAKIKDGEVKAAEIATNAVGSSEIAQDAVGASELVGVTKLLFGQCALTDAEKTELVTAGGSLEVFCSINGVDADDTAVATLNFANGLCFIISQADPQAGTVRVLIRNTCSGTTSIGSGTQPIGIIVFDK